MKHILAALISTLLLIQSASAQLNIEIVSPEDGSKIHGGTFLVDILFTHSGITQFEGASVEGFADGQLWFYGTLGGAPDPGLWTWMLNIPYKTNIKGPHILSVTVFDDFTSASHSITVFR